jgi:hypothetical protein
MKILVCGSHAEAAFAKEAVYDAGCRPVGPVSNPLRALGLADQEQPMAALIDLDGIDDSSGLWLAEKLAERDIDLICLSENRDVESGLALREHTFVAKPAAREAIAQCVLACKRRRDAARRARAGARHATEGLPTAM